MEYFEPDLESPYPAEWRGKDRCADFEMDVVDLKYETPLMLYRAIETVQQRVGGDAEYVVAADYKVSFRLGTSEKEDFRYDDDWDGGDIDTGDGISLDELTLPAKRFEITVPKGMLTDLTSVPALARGVIGRVGPHLEAAIVHDFLYVAWQDVAGLQPTEEQREFSDKVMRAAMKAANVGSSQTLIIYDAVAGFGRAAYFGRNPYRYVKIP